MMKVSDAVADWIAGINPQVYAVCGAGAMHLNDSICNHPKIKVLAMHHEQAATFAAEAHARVTGKPGIVHVTAGPGGTNTITGIASAWVDSIPMIVIAGQVQSTTMKTPPLRQRGMNELGLVEMVKSITKYAVTVRDPESIGDHLYTALHLATHGRPGPVWIEIPLDVQGAQVSAKGARGSVKLVWEPEREFMSLEKQTDECVAMLKASSRPLCIIGNGVRLSGACAEMIDLLNDWPMPVVSSWNASDIVRTDHRCYIGRPGLFGDRAGNFAVQNADLILAIGTRLSIPQTGHMAKLFAPNAKKIVVDIDGEEARKEAISPDLSIAADARTFLNRLMLSTESPPYAAWSRWRSRCQEWKVRYPVMRPEYRGQEKGVNSYFFVEELSKHLADDAVVVTDVGAGFISTMQSLPLNGKQRLFHSAGVSSMGYGLPAAIGACVASGGRQTICLTGDGGLMFNLQELQTIVQHSLPIVIFVMVNNGYMTMQATQANHFGREAISSPTSGVSCPDFCDVAKAFGIPTWSIFDHAELVDWMDHVTKQRHPMLVQIHMLRNQPLVPRVQSRVEKDGKFIPTKIEDMFPYLSREEFAANMNLEHA